jgi:ABC-type sulfate transport system permease subunit
MFTTILGVPLSMWTVVVAHATSCMVTVFNNSIARLRRMSPGPEDASADLGAGVFTTFRLVTFPQLRSVLLAAGLLSFARPGRPSAAQASLAGTVRRDGRHIYAHRHRVARADMCTGSHAAPAAGRITIYERNEPAGSPGRFRQYR